MELKEMKYALYVDLTYQNSQPFVMEYEGPEKYPEDHPDYVRVSNIETIIFKPRAEPGKVDEAVNKLLTRRKHVEEANEYRLKVIDERIEEFRALPAPN